MTCYRRSTQIFKQHAFKHRPISQTPFNNNVLHAHRGGEYSVFVEQGQQMQGVGDEAPLEDDAALLDDLGPKCQWSF